MALTFEEWDWALDCSDNFRAAEVGDSGEEADFAEIASAGCCGSDEKIVTHPTTGKQIGCNYGH